MMVEFLLIEISFIDVRLILNQYFRKQKIILMFFQIFISLTVCRYFDSQSYHQG